jgi:SAM-dependent methyltransferase
MSTDNEWMRWGRQDPYFAVITNEKFRLSRINDEARREFFESGRQHAIYALNFARQLRGIDFKPDRTLDFGCGVGRITLGLAPWVKSVVGVDISPDMLAEARLNAERLGLTNVDWVVSDDALSRLSGPFEFINSAITFQHIEPERGRSIFARLLALLAPGGVAVIQITYAKAYHADTFGQPPVRFAEPVPASSGSAPRVQADKRLAPSSGNAPAELPGDPEMQMNVYSLSDLAFMLQSAGVKGFNAEFTDHGGELGVFLYFMKPQA